MLHRYSFKNFHSFKRCAEVSFLLGKRAATGWVRDLPSGERVSTIMAVFGANGAGKTAALKPLAFLSWFITESFQQRPDAEIPLAAYVSASDEPSEFEVIVSDADDTLWRYVLHATRTRVIHEALYRKHVAYKYVFVRDWDEKASTYLIKQQGFGFPASEVRKVRQNASLISTAAQYGVSIAKHVSGIHVVSNLNVKGRTPFRPSEMQVVAELLAGDEPLRIALVELLKCWDLGLSDISISHFDVTDSNGDKKRLWMPFGIHEGRDGEFLLPMEEESSGTQSLFVLLCKLMVVLSIGGIAVIDELENDLHPHMLEPIIDLFARADSNPKGAQLIFSCHTAEVLDFLNKSQVAFVEKNQCESELYRGDEIQGLRPDDNLRAKYMAGALGAIPRL